MMGAVFLCRAADPSDLETKSALLRAYDIPVVVQSPLLAQFSPTIFGGEILGADLFVPEEKLEEARALLASEADIESFGEGEQGNDSQGEV